ncbi:replication initiator protein A [Paenibacillus sp. 1P07SE]|uniref:replication initiator protein A n=1 Tax=Paenibacillus sp. 1P07SE TaxID=3132209 RepID=UPI0039A74EB1
MSFTHIETQLHELALECLKRKPSDPLKATAIREETLIELSRSLHEKVESKDLFMYANQFGESLKLRIQEQQDQREYLQAQVDILEKALRIQSVDYLRQLVPINTNIAQHALFSAQPRSQVAVMNPHGVRAVHFKNNTGSVLTTYEARVMGAVQALSFKQHNHDSAVVELKYADIIREMGMSDGAENYKRIQEALIRLKDIEVTLTQYQRAKNAEYEEIKLTRLIDEIVFRRKVGSATHYQFKFQIKLPQWLVEANREGNLFDVSLILMNDLKSYLAQGLYWLISSFSEESTVTQELAVLAGHFHFLDDEGEPITPVYKIVERFKQACEELQTVGFIEKFQFTGKKQGLTERYLTVTKNPVFLNTPIKEDAAEQLRLF